MEKIINNINKIIKLSILFVAGLLCCFLFSSCAKGGSSNQFKNDEIYISLNQVFDLEKFFNGKLEDFDVEIENNLILTEVNNDFKGVAVGQTFVNVVVDGKIVDSVLVVVKNSFAVPTGLSVSNLTISWNEVFTYINNQKICATYILELEHSNGSIQGINIEENQFEVRSSGSFKIRVKAIGNEFVDDSLFSEKINATFLIVDEISSLRFENIETTFDESDTSIKLLWEEVDNAEYEVLINDTYYYVDTNSFIISSHRVDADIIKVSVCAVDKTTDCKSRAKTINITKCETPQYYFENGKIYLQENEGKIFKVAYKNQLVIEGEDRIKYFTTSENYIDFASANEGVYEVKIQEISQSKCNSTVIVLDKNIRKLGSPDLKVEAVSNLEKVKVSLSTADNNVNKFSINVLSDVFEVEARKESGKVVGDLILDLADFNDGKYLVDAVCFGQTENEYVIASNKTAPLDFYKLSSFNVFEHTVENQDDFACVNDESVLKFSIIRNADKYKFFINNQEIGESDYELTQVNNYNYIKFVLDREALNIEDGQDLKFTVWALREDNRCTVSEKNITVEVNEGFEIETGESKRVLKNTGGDYLDDYNVTWNKNNNCTYAYEILKCTDYSFATYDSAWQIDDNNVQLTNNLNNIQLEFLNLDLGLYKVNVWEVAEDDLLLTAKNNLFEDCFIVGEQLQIPEVTFGFDKDNDNPQRSGYFINVENVDNANCFNVYLNNQKIASNLNLIGADNKYYFNINNNFALNVLNGGEFIIDVEVLNFDDNAAVANQYIFEKSEKTAINVKRLIGIKEYNVSTNEEKIFINILIEDDNVQDVNIKIGSSVFENENKFVFNILGERYLQFEVTDFKGEFGLEIFNNGYVDENNYFLESTAGSLTFSRMTSPYDLAFNDGVVSFEHEGTVVDTLVIEPEKFVVFLTIYTENDEVGKVWSFDYAEKDQGEFIKEFNIEDLIEIKLNSDNEFKAYYAQREKIKVSLVANREEAVDDKFVHLLPSVKDSENSFIEINQTKKPDEFVFNKNENKLEWKFDNSNFEDLTEFEFDIYCNGEKIDSVSSFVSSSGNVFDFEYEISTDFELGKTYSYYIVAHRPNFWSSLKSNVIQVQKLSPVKNVEVIGSKIYFEIENNEIELHKDVIYGTDSNTGNLFDCQTGKKSIKVIGADNVVEGNITKVYLDSDNLDIELSNVLNITYHTASEKVENFKIVWNAMADQTWQNVGADGIFDLNDLITYNAEIYSGDTLVKTVILKDSNLLLNNEELLDLSAGDYTVNVVLSVDDFEVEDNAKAFFGTRDLFKDLVIVKLEKVNADFSLNESEQEIAQELQKEIELSWTFNNNNKLGADIKYNIIVNNDFENIIQTVNTTKSISQTLFKNGINNIKIQVVSDLDIASEYFELNIDKFEEPDFEVLETGMINFDVPNRKYLCEFELSCNGMVFETSKVCDAGNCDISAFLQEKISSFDIDNFEWDLKIDAIAVTTEDEINSNKFSFDQKVLGMPFVSVNGNLIKVFNNVADKCEINVAGKGVLSTFEKETVNAIDGYTGEYFVFEIPSDWASGNYVITVDLHKDGYVSNLNTLYNFEIVKGDASVDELDIERIGNQRNDFRITGFDNVYANVGKIFVSLSKDGTFIGSKVYEENYIYMNEIEDDIYESEFDAGNYALKMVVYQADEELDKAKFSKDIILNFRVQENDVENIDMNEFGYLKFDSNFEKFAMNIENSSSSFIPTSKKVNDISSVFESGVNNKISVAVKGDDFETLQAFNLENLLTLDTIYNTIEINKFESDKLPDVQFNNDGVIEIELLENEKVFVEYNNVNYEIALFEADENLYLREIDVYETIGFSGDIDLQINVFKFKENGVKSENVQIDLIIKETGAVTILKQKSDDWIDDYLVYSHNDFNAVKFWLEIKYGDNKIYNNLFVCDDEFNFTEFLLDYEDYCSSGKYDIKIAPIIKSKTDNTEIISGTSASFSYFKLGAVDKFEVSKSGEICWENIIEENDLGSYHLVYDDGSSKASLNVPKLQEYVFPSSQLTENISYDISIRALAYDTDSLTSNARIIENVERLNEVGEENLVVENGVLKLNWGERYTDDELSNLPSNKQSIYDNGDFVKIVQVVFNKYGKSQNAIDKLRTIKFSKPFAFTMQDFIDSSFNPIFLIAFENCDNASLINMQVDVKDLISNIDEDTVDILDQLATIANDEDKNRLNNFKNFVTNENAFSGIAIEELMIDHLDNGKGENIVAGKYDIKIQNKGRSENKILITGESGELLKDFNTVNSEFAVIENKEILAAPFATVVKSDVLDDEAVLYSKYAISFDLVQDYAGNKIENYKLIMFSETTKFAFDIKKQGGDWTCFKDAESFSVQFEDDTITIPLNTVKNQIGLDSIIDEDKLFNTFDVMIYACGNDIQLNSKHNDLIIGFLDFNLPTLADGVLKWLSFNLNHKEFNTSMIVQKVNQNNHQLIEVVNDGDYSILDSDDMVDGYKFAAFRTQGLIVEDWEAYVDSGIYVLENIFKLYQPSVNVENGNIKIENNSNNHINYQSGFEIKNNTTKINNDERDLHFKISNESEVDYQVGSNHYKGPYKDYKDTENQAEEFFVRSFGTTATLESDLIIEDFDAFGNCINLDFNIDNIYLRSNESAINARMIDVSEISIDENGNVVWGEINQSVTIDDEVFELNNTNNVVIYSVIVEHYAETLSGGEIVLTENDSLRKEFYTLESCIYENSFEDGYFYKIKVQANAYSSTNNGNAFIVVEGNNYYKLSNAQFDSTSVFILGSEEFSNAENFNRVSAVENIRVEDGQIYFDDNEENNDYIVSISNSREGERVIVNAEIEDIDETKKHLVITDEKFENNNEYYVFIKNVDSSNLRVGSKTSSVNSTVFKLPNFEREDLKVTKSEFTKDTYVFDISPYYEKISSALSESVNVKISLTLDGYEYLAKNFNEVSPKFTITIADGISSDFEYFAPEGEIKIAVKVITDAVNTVSDNNIVEFDYNMSSFGEDDKLNWNDDLQRFDWKITTGKLAPSSEYFEIMTNEERNLIDIVENTDKIVFKFDGDELEYLTFEDNIEELAGRFYLKTDVQYLKPCETVLDELEIKNIEFIDEKITFNIDGTAEYISNESSLIKNYYDVRITTEQSYSNDEGMSGTLKIVQYFYSISDYYFQPNIIGEIIDFEVYVKDGVEGLPSSALAFEGASFDFDMFESGDGTEANPFIVKNAQQFKNINLRSSVQKYKYSQTEIITIGASTSTSKKEYEESQIYFKQMADVDLGSVDNFVIENDFNNNFDGNNFTLKYFANNVFDISSLTINSERVNDNEDIIFEKGASLFGKILSDGVVKNLKVEFSCAFNSANKNVMIAPLALQNDGTIENVSVDNFVFNFNSAIPDNTVLAFGGIVGINGNSLDNCKFNAETTISNTNGGQTNSQVLFGAITLKNNADITNCSKDKNINIDFINADDSFAVIKGDESVDDETWIVVE